MMADLKMANMCFSANKHLYTEVYIFIFISDTLQKPLTLSTKDQTHTSDTPLSIFTIVYIERS